MNVLERLARVKNDGQRIGRLDRADLINRAANWRLERRERSESNVYSHQPM